MTRVLVLYGSPHTAGSTARLLDSCISAIADAAVTRFDTFTLAAAPCDDCGFCHEAAACRHRDLDAFYEALEAADMLIVATPVYNRSFPAPLKAVIDRLQRYWAARFVRGERPPIAIPKKTVLLTAAGAEGADGVYVEEQLAPVLTVLNSTPAIAVHATATDRAPLSAVTLAAARHAGETVSVE